MEGLKTLFQQLRGLSTEKFTILHLAVIAAIVVITILIILLVRRGRLRKRLTAAGKNPKKLGEIFPAATNSWWLKNSGVVESVSAKTGLPLPRITGLDTLWIERLAEKGRFSDLRRVLAFVPERGLFTAFVRALDNRKKAGFLLRYLETGGDMLILRKLALSGKGEDFNGKAAMKMFSDQMDRIREMTGDPEWAARYFAIKILLHDSRMEKSLRAVRESLEDPHPIIRKTIAREYKPEENDREALLSTLKNMLATDPVQEVRETVWARINKDFSDLYRPDYSQMEGSSILHSLDFLRVGNKEDEDFALKQLQSKDTELVQKAAFFLLKDGILNKLLKEADLGDMDNFERTMKLLDNAAKVHVDGFLNQIETTQDLSELIMAARILDKHGNRSKLHSLAERIFSRNEETPEIRDAYERIAKALAARGGEKGYQILSRELENRKRDGSRLKTILEALTPDGDYVFEPVLFKLLTDPDVPESDAVIKAFHILTPASVIPGILDLLKEGREKHSHIVRIRALKVLGHYPDSNCIRMILENLPILPFEESRDFAQILSGHQAALFDKHAKELLESVDAKVRAALVSAVPATNNRDFLPYVKEGLKDADPDVRVASIIALIGYQETKYLPQTFDLLRDPVERVRETAARTISTFGATAGIQKMDEVLRDENEVPAVKKAVIEGLSVSDTSEAIDVLVEHLGIEDEEITEYLVTALARKQTPAQIKKIVEHFKNGDPSLRDQLTLVFKNMGSEGEAAMVELLKEDIPSLREFITDILEKTGFVESTIRKLTHRNSEVRSEAASVLSLIGTISAFRGIVLAARDPVSDVRVQVTKALERLNTKDGKALLDELTSDPDLRVRRYTHWALERLKSKNL